MYDKGICIYNKMINSREQSECNKCTWNPTYLEQLKEKNREKANAGGPEK